MKRMANITVPIQVNLPDDWVEQIVNRLRNDPESEWVEIIRCKDCKHHVLHPRMSVPWCRLLHSDMGDNQFCSYAERRGEQNE